MKHKWRIMSNQYLRIVLHKTKIGNIIILSEHTFEHVMMGEGLMEQLLDHLQNLEGKCVCIDMVTPISMAINIEKFVCNSMEDVLILEDEFDRVNPVVIYNDEIKEIDISMDIELIGNDYILKIHTA
ncbi:hypothetical protein KQI86_03975 [Clostridium sp. MSJ-11]|uniref:Uncharacterized protein n=1 Tax=Clostridium mobile TaxID=2841512 RepID=A0ABS6EGE7_9CLOT|nr:hypothetical protein [Clostridium mobile]MBU5483474.1 hypothetical protein [Clostridium mobile]